MFKLCVRAQNTSLGRRLTSNVRYFSSEKIADSFKASQSRLLELSEAPNNEVKLKLYGLFKQASTGPEHDKPSRPSFVNPVGQAKYDAWAKVFELSQEAAMQDYSKLVEELHEEMGTAGEYVCVFVYVCMYACICM